MCGIAAVLLYPQERPAEIWQAIRETFTRNLLANEERGKVATGLAVVQAGRQVTVQKMAAPATTFVNTTAYERLLAGVGPQTTLLMGHTRHPTKGNPAHNVNNHPLQAGPIFGIHNGHIQNDDALFARCNCLRRGQVDSEVIFRLLERLPPPQVNDSYLALARSQLRQLQGEFTFLSYDQRAPDKLLVVRYRKPLSVHFHPLWNALVFSSRYIFLRKTFGPVLLSEKLPQDHLLLFDVQAMPRLSHRPAAILPL